MLKKIKIIIHAYDYELDKRPVVLLLKDIIQTLSVNYKIIVITRKKGQDIKRFYNEDIILLDCVNTSTNLIGRVISNIIFFAKSFYYAKENNYLNDDCIHLIKSSYGISTLISSVYKRLFRFKSIFWVLDRCPDSYIHNKLSIVFKVLKKIEINSLNKHDHIVFELKSDFIDYISYNGTATSSVINTWATIDPNIKPTKPNDFNVITENKPYFIYTGNIGNSFDIKIFIEICEYFSDNMIVVCGRGSHKNKLEKEIINNNILNAKVIPILESCYYYYYLKYAQFGLIILKSHIEIFSSKLTNYIYFDLPIIANLSKRNEMYNIIDGNIGMIYSNDKIINSTSYRQYKSNMMKIKKLYSKHASTRKFISIVKNL